MAKAMNNPAATCRCVPAASRLRLMSAPAQARWSNGRRDGGSGGGERIPGSTGVVGAMALWLGRRQHAATPTTKPTVAIDAQTELRRINKAVGASHNIASAIATRREARGMAIY